MTELEKEAPSSRSRMQKDETGCESGTEVYSVPLVARFYKMNALSIKITARLTNIKTFTGEE